MSTNGSTKEALVKNKVKLGALFPLQPVAVRKLDIACGQNKTKGFKGIDRYEGADITHDLFSFPWPIKTSSVKEAVCNHFVEHIPHSRPDWDFDGWFMFFAEVHRISANGATITLMHPYVWNDRAFWDPTHVRFIHWMSYYYLNKEWRTQQGLDHYAPDIDFEIVSIDGQMADTFASRNDEAQNFAREFYKNSVGDLQVILRVVK